MKKIILIAALALSALTQAQQISVVRPGGAELHDGDTFITNSIVSTGSPENKLRFRVTNLTEDELNVGVKVLGFSSNVDGSHVQLCFDTCLYEIWPNLIIPAATLDAGATTPSTDDHFWNFNAGTDGQPVTYHLAFVKGTKNEDGDFTETEELLDFTYTYDSTASINTLDGLQQMGVTLQNTVIKNALNITATQNAGLQILDINGKVVKTASVKTGAQAIDLSAFTTGVYFARFTTAANKTATVKIVKN